MATTGAEGHDIEGEAEVEGWAVLPDELQELIDRDRINRIVQAYAVAVDRRDAAAIEEQFESGARARYGGGPWLEGSEAIVRYVLDRTQGASWQQHLLLPNRIEVADDEATAGVYVLSHQTTADEATQTRMLSGEYRIELRRQAADRTGWRIRELHLRVGWVEQRQAPQVDPLLPPAPPATSPSGPDTATGPTL